MRNAGFCLYIKTIVFGLFMLGAPVVSAQGILEWQAEKTKALARIESQRCYGACQPVEKDDTVRTGTGFLVQLNGFDRPVVLTALHVVAGANFITSAFTEVDGGKVPVEVLAVDRKADIAILAAPDAVHRIEPLMFGDALPAGSTVIVYGYKEGAFRPISDLGRVKLMAPEMLSELPLGEAFDMLRYLGYPDLELPIVTLEEALTPGDSGAPVFNLDGRVVGMAHGGLPAAAAQVTWMVPASRILSLRPQALEVMELRQYGVRELFSTLNTFYGAPTATLFDNNPSVLFAIELPAFLPPIREFAARIEEAIERQPSWTERHANGLYFSDVLPVDDSFFPGASTEPYDCVSEQELCTRTEEQERVLLELFDTLALKITCYRAEVFEALLSFQHLQFAQADLDLEVPIGPLAQRVRDRDLELSYDWSEDKLYLYSKKGIDYEFGSGRYNRHPDIDNLEELHGGACSLRITTTDFEKEEAVRAFDHALRYGGACLHLVLAPNTHTPIAFTSYLPLGSDLASGRLWGVLPQSSVTGTVDDMACQ